MRGSEHLAKPRITAAHTMAIVSAALKGMSGAAACEKPTIATLVGTKSETQRASVQLV